jgi:glucose/arabinose dehydrogenase
MAASRLIVAAALLGAVATVPSCSRTTSPPTPTPVPTRTATAAPPALTVTPVVIGLDIPWDVVFLPDGTMLYDQRSGGFSIRTPGGTVRNLAADLGDLWASGETGLMGLAVDPAFAANRTVYSCQGWKNPADTVHEVRVMKWTLDTGLTAAARGATIVAGISTTSGRHGGCRLAFDASGALMIGTGDAATASNPQNLTSLNGKTLRVNTDGTIPADNPFAGDANPNTRKLFTYGHRNVQGLARRPGTTEMWSAEHGPDRDDEVNRLLAGRNYGWNPVPSPYNESVPMTDLAEFPNAVPARWSSGFPTVATSGTDFLVGPRWGSWQGALAVAALKGSKLLVMSMNSAGTITKVDVPTPLNGTYGRLRAVRMGPDGNLYLSTSNGSVDKILRVSPPLTPPMGPGRYRDYTGDGHPDVVARSSDGLLRLYPGTGTSLSGPRVIGTGWDGFTALFSPGDWDGDGWPDILARTSTGDLRAYFWTGAGFASGFAKVGVGWNGVSLVFSPGDFNRDGPPDIMGRTADGRLHLWHGNGAGITGSAVIGVGWSSMTALLSSGDFNGDRDADLLARTSDGVLRLYAGNGAGLNGSQVVGAAWNGLSALFSPGDFDGDGKLDVIGRTGTGDLRLYRWGGSSFLPGSTTIGIGWNGQNAIF